LTREARTDVVFILLDEKGEVIISREERAGKRVLSQRLLKERGEEKKKRGEASL